MESYTRPCQSLAGWQCLHARSRRSHCRGSFCVLRSLASSFLVSGVRLPNCNMVCLRHDLRVFHGSSHSQRILLDCCARRWVDVHPRYVLLPRKSVSCDASPRTCFLELKLTTTLSGERSTSGQPLSSCPHISGHSLLHSLSQPRNGKFLSGSTLPKQVFASC